MSSLLSLKTAGAEIAAITANTEHIVWDMICDRFPLPVIGVVDVVIHEIERMNFKSVLVFGDGASKGHGKGNQAAYRC